MQSQPTEGAILHYLPPSIRVNGIHGEIQTVYLLKQELGLYSYKELLYEKR